MKETLEKVERHKDLGAFLTLNENALKEAEEPQPGPLYGLPVAIKDLAMTKGLRTTWGSNLYRDFVPEQDSIQVERVKKAGGIVLGKTSTPEFGYKAATDGCRNPWDKSKTPGGSSGGSAVAVAAGLVTLAEGTDGAGSIRVPASFCGVVGLKPTFGRVPRYPLPDQFNTLSHTGPIARTVADVRLFLGVLAGPDGRDPFCYTGPDLPAKPNPRIAFTIDLGYVTGIDPEIQAILQRAARMLGAEPAHPRHRDPEPMLLRLWETIYAARLGKDIERLSPELQAITERGMRHSARQLLEDAIERSRLYDEYARFFAEYDLLLTPTVPIPPFDHDWPGTETLFGWTPFTYPFNLTGSPAISLPAGFTSEGLPVGIQIVGRRGEDEQVLQAAERWENLNSGLWELWPAG